MPTRVSTVRLRDAAGQAGAALDNGSPHPPPAGAGGAPPESSSFQRLLGQLAAEHDGTVAQLRRVTAECAQLKRTCREQLLPTPPDSSRSGSCRGGEFRPDVDSLPATTCMVVNVPLPQTCCGEELNTGVDSLPGIPCARRSSLSSISSFRAPSAHTVSLSNLGNKHFRIKDMWLAAVETHRLEAAKKCSQTMRPKRSLSMEAVPTYNGMLRHFISYPSSPTRMAWDVTSAALIFYDLWAIPLLFAFEPSTTAPFDWMDWLPVYFWTLDVLASFLVGYVKDGVTHMSPKEIAARYARTWLALDLLVLALDWGFTLGSMNGAGAKGGNSVKLVRIVRLFRMVRLLRVLKFRNLVQNLDGLIHSEWVAIVANIWKMIVLLLVINHYISCIWYLIGTMGVSASWIKDHGFEGAGWQYKYFTSFHWGITQFTPASMHVQPQNIHERVYAIAVVVFALVGFSYVVGSITGSLTQLRSMQESTAKKFWTLRCYLKQNRVSLALAARVHRYLEHVWRNQQGHLSVEQIPLLSSLSDQLRSELQCEIFVPQLSVHPLFGHLETEYSMTMCRLANHAISRKVYALNDTLFIPGEHATHMSFVRTGTLEYTLMDADGMEHTEWVQNTEDWIAEPVLWMSAWAHMGSLTTTGECELLLVDPGKFCDIINLNPPAFHIVSSYARNFAKWAESEEAGRLSDVCQGDEVGPRVRMMMGLEVPPRRSSVSSAPARIIKWVSTSSIGQATLARR